MINLVGHARTREGEGFCPGRFHRRAGVYPFDVGAVKGGDGRLFGRADRSDEAFVLRGRCWAAKDIDGSCAVREKSIDGCRYVPGVLRRNGGRAARRRGGHTRREIIANKQNEHDVGMNRGGVHVHLIEKVTDRQSGKDVIDEFWWCAHSLEIIGDVVERLCLHGVAKNVDGRRSGS